MAKSVGNLSTGSEVEFAIDGRPACDRRRTVRDLLEIIGCTLVAQPMRNHTQPSPREAEALHHIAQSSYRGLQHLARVADAFVDADGHAPGAIDGVLPRRVVDGEVPRPPTLRAPMRVQVEGNAVVWLARSPAQR